MVDRKQVEIRKKQRRAKIVFKRVKAWIRRRVAEVVTDDEKRFRLQMIWVFRILTVIVLVMTGVNLLTGEYASIAVTLSFGVACFISAAVLEKRPEWKWGPVAVMMAAVTALFAYYIISGEPEGFSAIWICLTPPVALLLLGRKPGGLLCWVLFGLMVFLMWLPLGRALLWYDYADVFLMRLPLLYLAAFGVSWFLEYVREVTQKKLVEAQRSYQHLYRHDALTGVMNRHGFNEHIAGAAEGRHPQGLALMIIDLDDFKRINDQYGHPAGDVVLCRTAQTIREALGDQGEVSRWGGEEFAVLLGAAKDAQAVAAALRAAVADTPVEADGHTIRATVSVGLTICEGGAPIDAERLVTLTDQALYRAKKNGKNQVAWTVYTAGAE